MAGDDSDPLTELLDRLRARFAHPEEQLGAKGMALLPDGMRAWVAGGVDASPLEAALSAAGDQDG